MPNFLPQFTLPLPAGVQPLCLTLALIDTLEQTGGSLYAAAEALIARQLPLGDVLRFLTAAYRQSGCTLDEKTLHSFLMTQEPAALLTRLFSAILSPLAAVAPVQEFSPAGEAAPACAG